MLSILSSQGRLSCCLKLPFKLLRINVVIVIFVVGCPANWLNVGTTCMVFRGGGKTFKEATDYCQVLCIIS